MNGNNSTAVEIIVETLKQSIQQGTLNPGDKLPTLKQMEEIYCVSRIVIREAIKVLEGQGLIYSKQGSGIYITEHSAFLEPSKSMGKEYAFSDIYSLFKFIYDYAVFELKKQDDLSEILELKKLNRELIDSYPKLTNHQKFTYETTFGIRLIRLSKNELAYDFYLMLIKPLSHVDYLTATNSANYLEILKIDENLIQAILDRDPYRASFLGGERTLKTISGLKDKGAIFDKKYKVFVSE